MQAIDRKAPLIALAAAAFFGLSTPLAKMLLDDVSPWLLAGLLYLGSGLGLSIVISVRKATGAVQGEASRRGPICHGSVERFCSAVFWGQSC